MTDILRTDSNGAHGWRSLNGRKEEKRSTRNIAVLLGRASLFLERRETQYLYLKDGKTVGKFRQ